MNKQWRDIGVITAVYLLWRLAIEGVRLLAPTLWPLRLGYLGSIPWANFDGVHYLAIAHYGYSQYEQAFFPMYPMLINGISRLGIDPLVVAVMLSHVALFGILILLWKLSLAFRIESPLRVLLAFLLFPAGFFLASVYSESVFLFFVLLAWYAAVQKRWMLAGIAGMIASATRLFGVVLFAALLWYGWMELGKKSKWQLWPLFLIPVGLGTYMAYLFYTVHDPLAFFHVQSAFGAGRSSGALIFLPQVLWRYGKIFLTASSSTIEYGVAMFEFVSLLVAAFLLWFGWKMRLHRSLLLYAAVVLIIPTLTGTLSSYPRYILSAFPLFFVFGSRHNIRSTYLWLGISAAALVYFCTLFIQGYFVS